VETDDDSIGGHFLHLLHGKPARTAGCAPCTPVVILYAEHEFNASTFTCRVIAGTGSDMYSAITGGIGALRGPEAWRRQRSRLRDPETLRRHRTRPRPISASRVENKEVVIGFGHPVYTVSDPRNVVIKRVAKAVGRGRRAPPICSTSPSDRERDVGRQEDVPQSRLVQRRLLPSDGRADRPVHALFVIARTSGWSAHVIEQRHRQQDHPPLGQLCRPRGSEVRAPEGPLMPYLVAADLPTESAGKRFRAALVRPGIFKLPGAHNGQAALQAKQAGFDGLYLSGAAMTASMGLPDLGFITVDEVAFFVRQVARASGLPVLVDGDTGYGEVLNVMHMVRTFEDAGAARCTWKTRSCRRSAAT
jgi:hypothetical protein